MKLTARTIGKWREHAREESYLRSYISPEEWEELCELAIKGLTVPEGGASNDDLTRAIDKMHDAILDTEASGRPAGNLFQVWWNLKKRIEPQNGEAK